MITSRHSNAPPRGPNRTGRAPTTRARRPLPTCRAGGEVTLPNGLTIRHASTADEALFFYREHWVDRVYMKHGVELRLGDTVVDVGSNVGLFAMAAAEACGPSGRVICLEPIPAAAAALRENAARHAAWRAARGGPLPAPIEVVEAAAGDGSCREAEFTVYERASGWSTMAPDETGAEADMEAYIAARIAAMGANTGGGGGGGGLGGGGSGDGGGGGGTSTATALAAADAPVGLVERLLLPAAAALQALPFGRAALGALSRAYVRAVLMGARRTVRCRLVALGELLREMGVERVGLLKVDVERSELAVLRGLGAGDWLRVEQAAVEVHDKRGGGDGGGERDGSRRGEPGSVGADGGSGGIAAVVALLRGAGGFTRAAAEQEPALAGTGLFNVYATRR